ncbi:MAG: type II toxin-antitoxin system VapC family toxin [Caldilineaceae bacterium]|nr:type II toxin-antitoxin system VapC family toxin [Caldilineaceae bacterium]
MNSSSICLDANAVVHLVLRQETPQFARQWLEWSQAKRTFIAPSILYYEVGNALYQYYRNSIITHETLTAAQRAAMQLGIRLYADAGVHQRALDLCIEFALPAIYDAHYLAIAERFGAELWTADQRFQRKVATLPWVRLIER